MTTNDNLEAIRFYQRRGYRIAAIDPGAIDRARRMKPSIPFIGCYGIPTRDELTLVKNLAEVNSAASSGVARGSQPACSCIDRLQGGERARLYPNQRP